MLKKRLGDMLVEMNYISEVEVEKAVKLQKSTGKRLGEILIDSGLINEEDLLKILEVQTGVKRIYIDSIEVDMKAVTTIPESLARKYNVLPIKFLENKLLVVMSDPLNMFAEEDVSIASGYQVEIASASKIEISDAITKYYSRDYIEKATEEMKKDKKEEEISEETLFQEEELKKSPAVKLIDTIIENAVKARASDIHIEPYKNKMVVRYRIDGSLKKQFETPKEPFNAVITRIKILSSMDIAERRIPQDGKMVMNVDGKDVDLRVSVLPAVNGENIVIRILDKSNFILDKQRLGLNEDDLKLIENISKKPFGIVLVTGPTGSGKTTTLYSILKDLNTEFNNVITIEDPVELAIDGLVQINVNTKAGLTFNSGLRSMLRQDPDVIMVGEIRDNETAEMAVRAAITGHLVLSTLHTNDAVSSIVRLLDMGIPAYLLSASLSGIVAQRLVRRLCDNCKEEYYASQYEKEILGIRADENVTLHKAKGCIKCSNIGYKGRIGIYEILEMNKDIADLINNEESLKKIKKSALESGMTTLLQAAINRVVNGNTTIEELLKVTLTND